MTNKEKKELAKDLFLQTDLSQKEIAERLGISEVTLSTWKTEGEWAAIKVSITTTERNVYANILQEIEKLQEEKKFDTKTANAYVRLLNQLRPKEEVRLAQLISGFMEFTEWLGKHDLESAKAFNKWQLEFISEKMKTIKK